MTSADESKRQNAAWQLGVTDYELGNPIGQNYPDNPAGTAWYRAGWRHAASKSQPLSVILRVPVEDAILLQKAIAYFRGEVGGEDYEKLVRWRDELAEQEFALSEDSDLGQWPGGKTDAP